MNVSEVCTQILDQLAALLQEIDGRDFTKPSKALSQSTIGQHLRHTLEFFICFEQGFERGVVNYDKRAHDRLTETDKLMALNTIRRIRGFVSALRDNNKPLRLEVGFDPDKEQYISIETNAVRELVYNIEHAVHHMAIMKIGIREVAPYISLPPDFGVAASTVRYREAAVSVHH
ncbi:hypothetical protein KK083_24325 [Fulvivirgaceae bacterium PWU4]|uniref:DinB family protein n=1 Tax=Chryseosolibacter histidini TaxID=2782349 RepID=A0AAP2DP93_9BACT|nr:hypothetical protein [Chryseosolibacter histidini]MBT1700036.1 hypothetical protein [Chryseosolibacter histidini]